jgi:hypothetical protein
MLFYKLLFLELLAVYETALKLLETMPQNCSALKILEVTVA